MVKGVGHENVPGAVNVDDYCPIFPPTAESDVLPFVQEPFSEVHGFIYWAWLLFGYEVK
jgi:hypothetical protein